MRNPTQEGRRASRCLAPSYHHQTLYQLQDHMLSTTTSHRWTSHSPALAMRVKELGRKLSTGSNCGCLYMAADSIA